MQITCSTCSDLFAPKDTVLSTSCGHLFHDHCLLQWLERSKSCPQCRAITSEKNVCRIYFNIDIHSAGTDVADTLQNEIDCLEFNMSLKKTEFKKCKKEMDTFNKTTTELENGIKRLKDDLKSAESNNSVLREQLKNARSRSKILESAPKERERLQKEAQSLRKSLMGFGIETVIEGSSKEFQEIINHYGDSSAARKSLLMFTSVLKKGIKTIAVANKQASTALREVESKVLSLTGQVQSLEEKIKTRKEQNHNLLMETNHEAQKESKMKEEVDALRQALISPTDEHPYTVALRRVLSETPAPDYLKRAYREGTLEETLTKSPDPTPPRAIDKKASPPYWNIKSSAFGVTPLRPNQLSAEMSKYSIFRKYFLNSSKENHAPPKDEEYDGMGGHAKIDVFPQPIRDITVNKKQRRSKKKLIF